jgi:hypothetical protein
MAIDLGYIKITINSFLAAKPNPAAFAYSSGHAIDFIYHDLLCILLHAW